MGSMARKLRVQYSGAIYHVMNRGDRREPIFKDDQDRQRFLATLGEACVKTGWEIHAYCLMSNHFHLVIETPNANLVAGMKWFLGTYTSRFNRRHRLNGHLFSGRYKSLIVDGSGDGYLRTVCDYVHLNPVRAKLLARVQPLETYVWSSYAEYLKNAKHRVSWLRVDRLLGELGIGRDDAAGRRQFAEAMEERRATGVSPGYRR
jgi:REP element-mobilizing transposase RayT